MIISINLLFYFIWLYGQMDIYREMFLFLSICLLCWHLNVYTHLQPLQHSLILNSRATLFLGHKHIVVIRFENIKLFALFEAIYGWKCHTPISWDHPVDRVILDWDCLLLCNPVSCLCTHYVIYYIVLCAVPWINFGL